MTKKIYTSKIIEVQENSCIIEVYGMDSSPVCIFELPHDSIAMVPEEDRITGLLGIVEFKTIGHYTGPIWICPGIFSLKLDKFGWSEKK